MESCILLGQQKHYSSDPALQNRSLLTLGFMMTQYDDSFISVLLFWYSGNTDHRAPGQTVLLIELMVKRVIQRSFLIAMHFKCAVLSLEQRINTQLKLN